MFSVDNGVSLFPRIIRVALIANFAGVLMAAEQPKPSLKLVNSVVQVSPSPENSETGDVLVQAENFPKGALGKNNPKIEDLRAPPTPFVQVAIPEFVRELSRSDTAAIWLYKLTVTGLPKQSLMSRKMLLALGTEQFVVDYTLTNKAATTFVWSFLPPPVWNLADSSVAEIPVIVKDVQATGIRMLQSTLTRQGNHAISLGIQNLQLCMNHDGPCQSPDRLGPSDSRTLYLRMKGAANGTYAGNIVIRCDQKPEGDTLAVTANVTTTTAQWNGVGAIALGIVLYFSVVVIARWRLAKNSRKELALLLLTEVEEVKQGAARMLVAVPDWAKTTMNEAFRNLENRLSDQSLRPVMPGPLNPDANADDFKSTLQSIGARLQALRVVIELGMSGIARAWEIAGADTGKQDAVKKAVDDLLGIPDGEITPADTKTKVAQILTVMDTALGVVPASGLDKDTVQMQLQHVWLSSAGWTWLVIAIWLAVTIITGVMVMVLSKPGFGTPTDYALCILWGFGLPASGTQLNQLSASSVAPTLGITLPKAAA